MTRSRCGKLLLAFLWIAVSGVCSQEMNTARAQSANVSIHDVPIAQLMPEITKPAPSPLRDYFAGVLAAREGKDEEAIQLLTQAWPPLRRTDPDKAALALRLLADVYDRESLYARSSPLYDELETSGLLNRLPETYRQGAKDDAELARVLASSPVQTIARNGPVHLATSRNNPLGLITTELTVNGVRSEWILDTGTNESVVSRSLASQLHLPTLPGVAHTSGGVTGIENELHVALLPNLPLGSVTAHNVVLMVLDDANLTIPNGNGGSYRIAGIIGFPVLRALGRITFHDDGTFDATVDGGSASAGSALELHMLNPVIEATVEGEPLPFPLDTAASGTNSRCVSLIISKQKSRRGRRCKQKTLVQVERRRRRVILSPLSLLRSEGGQSLCTTSPSLLTRNMPTSIRSSEMWAKICSSPRKVLPSIFRTCVSLWDRRSLPLRRPRKISPENAHVLRIDSGLVPNRQCTYQPGSTITSAFFRQVEDTSADRFR